MYNEIELINFKKRFYLKSTIYLHRAKSIFLKGDRREMLLIELFVVLLKLDPSIAESIDIENVSMLSDVEKDIGEFDTGKDMLRSNL